MKMGKRKHPKGRASQRCRLLNLSRKHLGLAQVRRIEVVIEAAKEMNEPIPPGINAQYDMLARLLKLSPSEFIAPLSPRKKKARSRQSTVKTWHSPEYLASADFLTTWEWRTLRMKALVKWGPRCQCCGAEREDGVKIHVDHIKPRATHPEMALDLDNLQILCEVCNQGKGSWDDTDWRPAAPIN